MSLSRREVRALSARDWECYKAGRCLCAAFEPDECACGAWAESLYPRWAGSLVACVAIGLLLMAGFGCLVLLRLKGVL
jgi:hypothetical protein